MSKKVTKKKAVKKKVTKKMAKDSVEKLKKAKKKKAVARKRPVLKDVNKEEGVKSIANMDERTVRVNAASMEVRAVLDKYKLTYVELFGVLENVKLVTAMQGMAHAASTDLK